LTFKTIQERSLDLTNLKVGPKESVSGSGYST